MSADSEIHLTASIQIPGQIMLAARTPLRVAFISLSLACQLSAQADPQAFQVIDGTKVDAGTYAGFKAWQSAGCARCHGADQAGLVGPSLIERLKVLSRSEFIRTVLEGRSSKGMPSFASNTSVNEHMDSLYVYLKGRSDGTITSPTVEPLP